MEGSRTYLSSLPFLVDTLNSVQKIRQSTGNRVAHLELQGKSDPVVLTRHKELQDLEDRLVSDIVPIIKAHPTWEWASRVKGVGPENLAKVVGLIEKVEEDEAHGIELFSTPSKVVRYCGFAVIDGKAEKRQSGEKTHYNSELRSMLWRLGGNLLKAKGKFYEAYLHHKEYLEHRAEANGVKIMATPSGKFCPQCAKEVKVKTARFCPDCASKLALKTEPEGILFQGHLHNQALRYMIRLFIIMLDTAWREELGLPVREPYPVEKLGHSRVFKPEDFVDKS
ncbi:MAG: hypothetical protein Q7T57_00140 [Dehalococcoidales bacterium]|nr:hypothetical protein [Dehalococcoidales bacterium]